jgi:hypothetical protein
VEDDRGAIEDLRDRYGYEEKEAEAMYHLRQARSILGGIYQDEAAARAAADLEAGISTAAKTYSAIFVTAAVVPHFDALEGLLVKRSLDRQYPEGWGKQ